MAENQERVLAGRYRIKAPVGSGGMAKVFRGEDEVLGRTVAVKVLAPEYARDGQFVERFRREAQSAAALNHPNVVSVFDTGSDGSVHYIVMEFLEGRTLRDVVSAEGPLHPNRAAEIGEAVCRALSAAHQQGLVHRDVKPGNVMLTPSGEVKVMDFGIARVTTGEALTQTATVLGTASYFSPEQAKGESVDARSDVYSAGCVLYEMLTGRPPFSGDSPVSIAYKHVREDPVLPSHINADISPALDAVVMKAMAKNPANRYQTATEMAEDLHRVQEGEPVLATPILPGQTTQVVSRPVRHTEAMPVLPEEEIRGRRRWPIILTTLLILGLVGVAAFLLVRELDGGPPTVEVPNVVGLRAEAARNRLQADGFRVVVTRDVSDQPQGRVFRQIPDQGELVEEGSEVEIFVSSGPEPVVVPELIGKTIEDARLELQTAGLSLGGIREQPSDEFDEGQIIRQNPEAGDEVNPEAEVDVVVSSGRLTAFVPNVRCQTLADARAAITDQGLKFRVVGEEPSTVCETGTVASTDPEGGTEVPVGTTVDVFVAFESLPSPSPSPTTPTLPPSPTPT